MTRVNGKYLVEGRCYRYPMSQEDHLNIFYTPSGASEVIPTLSIAPGTVIATVLLERRYLHYMNSNIVHMILELCLDARRSGGISSSGGVCEVRRT